MAQIGLDYNLTVAGHSLKTDGFLDFESHRFYPQQYPSYVQFNLVQTQMDKMGYDLHLAKIPDELTISVTV